MTDFTHVIATTPEDLDRVLEVVRDQEFKVSEIRRDAAKGFVDFLFARRFPPHKGNWLLRIPWVRAWRFRQDPNHDRETLKEIRWDAKERTLKFRCVLDEYEAVVDRLDLRLGRLDEADAAKVTFDKLPEWLKAEVREKDAAMEAEYGRVRTVRRGLLVKGAAAMAAFSLLLGAVQVVAGGGRPAVDFALLPLVTGGAAWLCLATGRDQLTACLVIGLPAFLAMCAAMSVLQHGTALIAFCGGLLHMVAAQILMIWIRGERELHA